MEVQFESTRTWEVKKYLYGQLCGINLRKIQEIEKWIFGDLSKLQGGMLGYLLRGNDRYPLEHYLVDVECSRLVDLSALERQLDTLATEIRDKRALV